MARRRDRNASIERTVQAAADTVQAISETLVSTGLRGMKVVAAMGQAAAKGAVKAGRQVGGASGQIVANTAETLAGAGRRISDGSAEITRRGARAAQETSGPPRPRRRAAKAGRRRSPRAA